MRQKKAKSQKQLIIQDLPERDEFNSILVEFQAQRRDLFSNVSDKEL